MMLGAMMLLGETVIAQELAVKTNLLTDAMTVPSVGAEFTISRRWTLNVDAQWMPFRQSSNHYLRTLAFQAGPRFWFRAPFTGPFVGPELSVRMFNMGALPVFHLKEARTQGLFSTVGATVGWHFSLSPRWGLEPAVTLGYGYIDYKRYGEPRSRIVSSKGYTHYFGPVAASLNLVYLLQ